MANLYHFPTFHSLSSRKLPFFTHLPSLNSATGDHHNCRHTKIISCLKKSLRANRKARSDADLCNDIREFLSAVGLPENHVPTTKELSQHGRQDLANVVRRRGYKFIGKLLATSSMTNITESQIDTNQTINPEMLGGFEGQNGELDILSEDVLSNEEGLYGCIETDEELKPNDQSFVATVSNTLALQEKVAKFIQHGELDTIEDSSFGITNEYANGEILNGSLPTSVQNVEDPGLENSFSSYISSEEQTSLDHENLAEVKCLKFLLHQKELELTQLKEQIEKEKVALSVLQTKAETEISKAQKLISEKETELQSAEETLSGLKEVEIQYSGDGDTVELAGSFNGWDHKIDLELQQSADSNGSRLWRAVLWLYPGVYEIKFVVDGHWTTDPEMELVTRNSLQNNVLRVDR